MTITRFLGLRLFLEGIEVPVVSATVTARLLGPANAQIVVPPDDSITEFLPRTLVHLFYYGGPNMQSEDGEDTTLGEAAKDPNNWHLAFCGEVVGYQAMKGVLSRQVVLNCMDLTTYWDAVRMYFGTKTVGSRQFRQAIYMGSVVASKGAKKVDTSGALLRLLRTRPTTMPTLQGLLGGCVSLLESATGVFASTQSLKKFRGISDFLSQAELRLKLTKQLGINPNDTSSGILTNDPEFRRYIRRVVKSSQSTSSYGNLLRHILTRMHHVYSTVICPPYIPSGATAKYRKLVPIRSKISGKGKKSLTELEQNLDKLYEAVEARHKEVNKRVSTKGSPGALDDALVEDAFVSTTDFMGAVRDTEGHEAWTSKYRDVVPTSTKLTEAKINEEYAELPDAERTALVDAGKYYSNAITIVQEIMTPIEGNNWEDFDPVYDKAGNLVAAARKDGNEILGPTAVTNEGKLYPYHKKPNFLAASAEIEKARAALKKRARPKWKTVSGEIRLTDRLITTLFHPNIWMCPPPKCNVLFPDSYREFQFQRQFLQEPTRYMLFGLKRNGRQNWQEVYFAPNTDIITGGMQKQDVSKAAQQSISFLFPHEKYSGIIPTINGVGSVAALTKINREVEKISPGGATAHKRVKSPALSRAAHSGFFNDRYASRNLSFTGPLSPQLVCGLPILLLDPQLATSPDSPTPDLGGTHYLGFLSQLTHSFSQQGAITTGFVTYARPYNESLELFGTKDAKVKVTKEVGPNAKLAGTYWAEVLGYVSLKRTVGNTPQTYSVPIVGMMGVRGRTGKHVNLGLKKQNKKIQIFWKKTHHSGYDVDWPDGFRPERTTTGLIAYEITPVFSESRQTSAVVPTPGATGRINRDQWIDGYHYAPKLPWMSATALGAVEVEVRRKTKSDKKPKVVDYSFSFEQVARPPWVDKSYLNQNIGNEYYQQLLGCGALTDPTLIAELSKQKVTKVEGIGTLEDGVSLTSDRVLTTAQQDAIRKELDMETKGPALLDELLDDETGEFKKAALQIETKDGETFRIPAEIVGGDSIKDAVDSLASTYTNLVAETETAYRDVNSFIHKFTDRKFASMVDIFGYGWKSGALLFNEGQDGVVGTRYVMPLPEYDPGGEFTREQDNAREGFHSSAFGDIANLDLLPHESLADAYGGEPRDINPAADPRAERYSRVLAYRYRITKTIQRG